MARGSRSTTAQQKKSQAKRGGNGRMALKDAPAKGRGGRMHAQEEMRTPRIFDDRTKRDVTGVALIMLAVVLMVMVRNASQATCPS